MPAGYCGDHPPVNRDELPPHIRKQLRVGDPVSDDDGVGWDDKGELLYTAHEMHTRALHVQQRHDAAKASLSPTLHELPPEERRKQWDKLDKAHQIDSKRVGVRGLSLCSQLSYFRCACATPYDLGDYLFKHVATTDREELPLLDACAPPQRVSTRGAATRNRALS